MQKQSIKSIIFSALVIFLSACGGGDGDTSSDKLVATSTTPTEEVVSGDLTVPAEEVASEDSTTPAEEVASEDSTTPAEEVASEDSTVPSGTLNVSDSSSIKGLTVTCASIEPRIFSDGSFECSNFPISFYIGEFKIGEVQNTTIDNTFYTQDLLDIPRGATAHSEVTKISMILQSLDEDAQPFNGITLTDESLSLLSAHLSSTSDLTVLSFEDIDSIIEEVITARLNQDPGSQLRAVDYITAQSNLTTKIAELPALTYVQRTTEG